jgi:hypothetical protein
MSGWGASWPGIEAGVWGAQTRSGVDLLDLQADRVCEPYEIMWKLKLAGVAIQVTGMTTTDLISPYAPRRPSGSPKRSAIERDAAYANPGD